MKMSTLHLRLDSIRKSLFWILQLWTNLRLSFLQNFKFRDPVLRRWKFFVTVQWPGCYFAVLFCLRGSWVVIITACLVSLMYRGWFTSFTFSFTHNVISYRLRYKYIISFFLYIVIFYPWNPGRYSIFFFTIPRIIIPFLFIHSLKDPLIYS